MSSQTPGATSSPRQQVFIVQRGTALYADYEDKMTNIIGVYSNVEDANRAVRDSQKAFMAEFGIREPEDEEDFVGFCWEDRGSGSGESARVREGGKAGMFVGLYWEFEDGQCWYSCGVECWPVIDIST